MGKIDSQTKVSCGCGWEGIQAQLWKRCYATTDSLWDDTYKYNCPKCNCDHELMYEDKDDS